jgi:NADH pyrophosphatase NudC (nudix superfamily)/nicotinamide mononucleotide (NMN) deamidase PncC
MPSITSPHFERLVKALKAHKATCTVVESCCGGVINSSILAQPGASAVYWGGSVSYNTRKAKPFLLNNEELHQKLTAPFQQSDVQSEKDLYIQSKLDWTRETSLAFCREVGTDFCIAEGGAAGPTFRPQGLDTGFAVIAVAARQPDDSVKLIKQEVIHSTHADREKNMRLFADNAAKLALDAVQELRGVVCRDEPVSIGSSFHLDRATHLRSDEKKISELSLKGQYVVLYKNKSLFQSNEVTSERHLACLSLDQVNEISELTGYEQTRSFLGLLNDTTPMFGVDFQKQNESENDKANFVGALTNAYPGSLFEETRTVAPLLSPTTADNELALHATALSQWQRRSPHCPACGGLTILLDGGTSRKCSSCGQQSWPRQDPSMIAVVSSRDGERVLLARSPRHPERMHTALAGFVEAGETMERAVAREVFEETGVRIDLDSVKYVASQPWPFPQSTMIGFIARADESQDISIDPTEIVEARWFDRAEVQAATKVEGPVMQHEAANAAIDADPSLPLLIPPRGVLARTLIDTWLEDAGF